MCLIGKNGTGKSSTFKLISGESAPDLALLFLPGIALMAVLFSANSLAADYWVERDTGTLRRLVSAPSALMRQRSLRLSSNRCVHGTSPPSPNDSSLPDGVSARSSKHRG